MEQNCISFVTLVLAWFILFYISCDVKSDFSVNVEEQEHTDIPDKSGKPLITSWPVGSLASSTEEPKDVPIEPTGLLPKPRNPHVGSNELHIGLNGPNSGPKGHSLVFSEPFKGKVGTPMPETQPILRNGPPVRQFSTPERQPQVPNGQFIEQHVKPEQPVGPKGPSIGPLPRPEEHPTKPNGQSTGQRQSPSGPSVGETPSHTRQHVTPGGLLGPKGPSIGPIVSRSGEPSAPGQSFSRFNRPTPILRGPHSTDRSSNIRPNPGVIVSPVSNRSPDVRPIPILRGPPAFDPPSDMRPIPGAKGPSIPDRSPDMRPHPRVRGPPVPGQSVRMSPVPRVSFPSLPHYSSIRVMMPRSRPIAIGAASYRSFFRFRG